MAGPSTSTSNFGHGMRKHFLFRDDWTNLNHGSYGTYPRPVWDVKEKLIRTIEAAPDKFMRYDCVPLLNESRSRLADLLSVPVDEVVLVQNATTGVSTILRNLTFTDKDVVLCFETIYDAVRMNLLSIQETYPQVRVYQVEPIRADRPMSHDEMCEAFTTSIAKLKDEGYTVKAAVFDTITSVPALRLPFECLTKICRSHGILSVIDGAHGIGQIPLNLAELDADFFVSNCHKWLYVPRGCAVLHVPKRNQHLVRTTYPSSHAFAQKTEADTASRFIHQFQYKATADNTSFYCVAAALNFREQVCGGEEAIRSYVIKVAQEGADLIAKALGTSVMSEHEGVPSAIPTEHSSDSMKTDRRYMGLRNCAMANIQLPLVIEAPSVNGENNSSPTNDAINPKDLTQIASWMQRTLPMEYNTSLTFFAYKNRLWTRVSGQIYLELSDFEWLAGCLKDICKRVRAGEPLLASNGSAH